MQASPKSTWVLVRGLAREHRHWGEFPAKFEGAIAGARVIVLDLPGCGRLNGLPSLRSIEHMARYCRAKLLELHVAPPINVIGLSLGGMVAHAWAVQHPADVQRCVLINTSMGPQCPWHWRLRPRNYAALLHAGLAWQCLAHRERIIFGLTSRRRRESDLEDWIAIAADRRVSVRNALRQLGAASRYRAPLQAPAARLLLLASVHDALVDVRCSRRLARTWAVPLAEHPDAGHDIPLDDPDWVIEQIRAWLAREAHRVNDAGVSGRLEPQLVFDAAVEPSPGIGPT